MHILDHRCTNQPNWSPGWSLRTTREITVDAELWWQDKLRAAARSVWKRWRPRPSRRVREGTEVALTGRTLGNHVGAIEMAQLGRPAARGPCAGDPGRV